MEWLKRFLKNQIIHEDYIKRLEEQELKVISNLYTKFL